MSDPKKPLTLVKPQQQRRLLFLFNGRAAYEQQRWLAEILFQQYHIISLFCGVTDEDAIYEDELQKANFKVVTNVLRKCPKHKKTKFALGKLQAVMTLITSVVVLRKKTALAQKMIGSFEVEAVITAQERAADFLPLVAAAQRLKLPVILLPTIFLCMPDGGAFMRRQDASLKINRNSFSRMLAYWMPNQVFASRWGPMFCYSPSYLLSLKLSSLCPKNIWYQGTRFIDYVITAGEEEDIVCKKAGIPEDKVIRLGAPYFQMLYDKKDSRSQARKKLADRYAFDENERLVIFAVPVLWEHKLLPKETVFDFIETILPILKQKEVTVLLSLHPKSNILDYTYLQEKYAVKICGEPLFEYIYTADVFVATAYSSTIRWALALGLPTVNLDFWDLKESTYAGVLEYPNICSLQEFLEWYNKVLSESFVYQKTLRLKDKLPLGLVFDGQFPVKMYDLLNQISACHGTQ